MMFYLADGELETMKKQALTAVREAREFVKTHQRDD
jgi:hypothetical protein